MRWLLVPVAIAGLLTAAGAWFLYHQGIKPPEEETPIVQFAQEPELDPLEVLVIEQAGEETQAIRCAGGVCQQQEPAPVADAVTDGTWWYFYEEQRSDSGKITQALLRRNSQTGEQEVVMAESPLTVPRGLFMNPNNTHLAFFLDNKSDVKEQLTEIWVFDMERAGVRLIAEKIYIPDVRSRVRWNGAGTHLWYLANNSERGSEQDKLELVIADIDNPGARVMLAGANWTKYVERLDGIPADVQLKNEAFAATSTTLLRHDVLEVTTASGVDRATVRGTIPFLQWLNDESLLYVVQDRDGFTFWRRQSGGTHQFVARRPGQLQSARTDSSQTYLSFVVRPSGDGAPRVLSLHIASGHIGEEALLRPSQAALHVVAVRQVADKNQESVAAVTTVLDDTELAAFLDQHLSTIVGETVRPVRFTTTDSTNTVFVEYVTEANVHQRILLTIRDVIHVEWVIRARYEPVNATWRKTDGGGLADPAPVRLYEWEPELARWILKTAH